MQTYLCTNAHYNGTIYIHTRVQGGKQRILLIPHFCNTLIYKLFCNLQFFHCKKDLVTLHRSNLEDMKLPFKMYLHSPLVVLWIYIYPRELKGKMLLVHLLSLTILSLYQPFIFSSFHTRRVFFKVII